MGLQQWQVDIDGITQTVEVEHQGKKGTIRVDDCLVAEWKIPMEESSHHFTRIGGRVLGVHLFHYPDETAEWRYDCSLDGISIITDNTVWVRESTPTEGGYKAWDVDLPHTRIRMGMRHKPMTGAILLELNGETVATLREVDSDPEAGDYFLRLSAHRIGIHFRECADFSYRYDCSLDGRSVTTGQVITLAPLLKNEGGYAWLEEVDGSWRLFRLEHSPFRNRGTLWVDGEKVGTAGSFWNEREENWYSFIWSGHAVMVQAKESGDLSFAYQMTIDGRSVETGEPLAPPETVEIDEEVRKEMFPLKVIPAGGRPKWWMFQTPCGVRRVELRHRRWPGGMCEVWVDQERILKKRCWDRNTDFAFTVDHLPCRLQIGFDRELDRYRYDLWVDGARVETGKTSTTPVKELPSPSWKKRIMEILGFYLCAVAILYLMNAAGHWIGFTDPRDPGWYWILPAFWALYHGVRDTRVERWLQLGFAILVIGLIFFFLFGFVYSWMFT